MVFFTGEVRRRSVVYLRADEPDRDIRQTAIQFSRVLIGVFGDEDSAGRPNYYAVRMVVEQHADRSANLKEWEILGNVSAVNAKKIASGDVLSLTNKGADIAMQDTIGVSVPELLEKVKEIFPDSFSKDVYSEFGMKRHDAPNAGNHEFTPGLVFSIGGAPDGMGQVEVTDANGETRFLKVSGGNRCGIVMLCLTAQ